MAEMQETVQAQREGTVVWQPPPANSVKINWDAKVDHKCGRIGLECVVRDSRGSFLAGHSTMKMISTDSTTAEALATIQIVFFGKEQSYRHIIFQGDAMQIVQAVNHPSPCQSSYGHIVEGIHAEL